MAFLHNYMNMVGVLLVLVGVLQELSVKVYWTCTRLSSSFSSSNTLLHSISEDHAEAWGVSTVSICVSVGEREGGS